MDWKGINDTIEVGMFWSLSRDAVTSFVDHVYQHGMHQTTQEQA
jgi:hypothetical protein